MPNHGLFCVCSTPTANLLDTPKYKKIISEKPNQSQMKIYQGLLFSTGHLICTLPGTTTPSPACSTLCSGGTISTFPSWRSQGRLMKTGASKTSSRSPKLTMWKLEKIGKPFTGLPDWQFLQVSQYLCQ